MLGCGLMVEALRKNRLQRVYGCCRFPTCIIPQTKRQRWSCSWRSLAPARTATTTYLAKKIKLPLATTASYILTSTYPPEKRRAPLIPFAVRQEPGGQRGERGRLCVLHVGGGGRSAARASASGLRARLAGDRAGDGDGWLGQRGRRWGDQADRELGIHGLEHGPSERARPSSPRPRSESSSARGSSSGLEQRELVFEHPTPNSNSEE